MLEAAFAPLYDAAQVRLSQFGQAILAREVLGLDTSLEETALLDLRFGLEVIAQLAPGLDQDTVIGYLIETYGLLAVGTDPFLRPLLPTVPITGATVRRFIISINSRALIANTTLIGMGGVLVPSSTPAIPGPTYHGAVSSATPLAAEVQALLPAESWTIAPRSIIYNTAGTFPAFAEPQAYGPRLLIKDANGFDITTLLTQTVVSYSINGVLIPYYLYVFNLAQYDPALTINF